MKSRAVYEKQDVKLTASPEVYILVNIIILIKHQSSSAAD